MRAIASESANCTVQVLSVDSYPPLVVGRLTVNATKSTDVGGGVAAHPAAAAYQRPVPFQVLAPGQRGRLHAEDRVATRPTHPQVRRSSRVPDGFCEPPRRVAWPPSSGPPTQAGVPSAMSVTNASCAGQRGDVTPLTVSRRALVPGLLLAAAFRCGPWCGPGISDRGDGAGFAA